MNLPDFEIAPFLLDGELATPATEVVIAARELGDSRWASLIRASCVPFVFHEMERVFAGEDDPALGLREALNRLAAYLRACAASGVGRVSARASASEPERPVEQVTGEHYGRLFREFDLASFAEEPARLLGDRLTRNAVDLPDMSRARVLDAGCGGGRYSVAWKLLGAREVLGVDVSEPGIADARARVSQLKIGDVSFSHMDVVDLPVEANSFDVVFSNGVLHHTRDWQTGIRSLVRALKPGGLGWLYLIEKPGGHFWDMIELCRVIMGDEIHEHARLAVAALGIPANRVFYMLDHVMVPINVRLTADQISSALREAGARQVRRLNRGTGFDRVEHIFQNEPHAKAKYGVGEHRFVFSK